MDGEDEKRGDEGKIWGGGEERREGGGDKDAPRTRRGDAPGDH